MDGVRGAGAVPAAGDDARRREGRRAAAQSSRDAVVLPARARLPLQGRIFTETEGEEGQDKVVCCRTALAAPFGGNAGAPSGRRCSSTAAVHDRRRPAAGLHVPLERHRVCRSAVVHAREKSDERRHSNNWQMIGRLKPGATVEQAQQQIDALNARNDERFPAVPPDPEGRRLPHGVVCAAGRARPRRPADAVPALGRRPVRAAASAASTSPTWWSCARARADARWRRATRSARASAASRGSC